MATALVLSAVQAMVFSANATHAQATGLSIPTSGDGVTITAGTPTNIVTATTVPLYPYGVPPLKRSATQAIVIVGDTGNVARAQHVAIGAAPSTTITAGTLAVFPTAVNPGLYDRICSNLVFMATDEWWFFYQNSANDLAVCKLTVSGSTVTLTAGTGPFAGSGDIYFRNWYSAPSAAKLSATQIMGHVAGGLNADVYIGTMTGVTSAGAAGLSIGVASSLPNNVNCQGNDWSGYIFSRRSPTTGDGETSLIYIDEAMPGGIAVARAAASLNISNSNNSYLQIIRTAGKDIVIGGQSSGNLENPGAGLILNRTGKTQFDAFSLPFISLPYKPMTFSVPSLFHIGGNNIIAFGGYTMGRVYCFEVCQ
ncbi:MAG: hypothetical protein ABL951_06980 [Alphaproteobacteria bacterium]